MTRLPNPFTPLGWGVVALYLLVTLATVLLGWPAWVWLVLTCGGLLCAAGLLLRLP
jgi:hypothetical protein